MGSRIMHLIIANRITEELTIKDQSSFLLGGISPDAVYPKESSHFFTGNVDDFTRSIDYQAFLKKYARYEDSPYVLGYYTHLIADDLWLKGFYLPWLKNRMNADPMIHTKYHQDFRLLNAKLLKRYDPNNVFKQQIRIEHAEIIELEEIKSTDVINFIPSILDDINYPFEHIDSPLQVFTEEQIIGYIETSAQKAIQLLNTI